MAGAVVTTVLTMGTFDLLHPGHVALFRACRALAGDGRVVVAVNTDEFVAEFKRHPVMSYVERAEVVRACRYVDDVIDNDGRDQAALITLVGPDVLVVGKDWATRDYFAQIGVSAGWLAERRITLVYVEHEHSVAVSTTKVRERMGVRDA